jgi:parallel beta-helix repeat protein
MSTFEEEIKNMGDPNYSLILIGEERLKKLTEELTRLSVANLQLTNIIRKFSQQEKLINDDSKTEVINESSKKYYIVSKNINDYLALITNTNTKNISLENATYYRTIGSAIYEADEETIIYVMPGIYYEHLDIKKNVTIIGINTNGEIEANTSKYGIDEKLIYATIIGTTDTTIRLSNCKTKFKRIRIQNTGALNFAILACDWSGEFEECSISAEASGLDKNGNEVRWENDSYIKLSFAFYNYYVKARWEECKLLSCNFCNTKKGTAFYSMKPSYIEKSKFENNGLAIRTGGTCTQHNIIKCEINNNDSGIYGDSCNKNHLEGNIIRDNKQCGVWIDNSVEYTTLCGNQFTNNGRSYICFRNGGTSETRNLFYKVDPKSTFYR